MYPKSSTIPDTKQRRRLWFALISALLGWVAWASVACVVGPECEQNIDCGGALICVSGVCAQPPKEQGSTETSTEPSAEGSGEGGVDALDAGPPPEDDPLPETSLEGDTDPGTCIEGHTRPCYSGPAGTQDVGECAAGTQSCVGGVWDPVCKDEALPSQEICDGKDNDCDGKADDTFAGQDAACQVEGQKGPCTQGKMTCEEGKPTCVSSYTPQPEDCSNQLDDDCDGLVDGPPCTCNASETRECYTGHPAATANVGACIKGQQTCGSDSKWGKCEGEITPQAEICNGKDDDCDGQTDEDFPEKGQSCTDKTQKGECTRGKYTSCKQGQLECTSQVTSTKEVCGNGKDDDCNGQIDENPPCLCKAGQQRSCYSGAAGTDKYAPCKRGTQTCDNNGTWGICTGEVTPKPETCDGKDESCDGRIDEGLSRSCQTACGKGTETCSAGKWGSCSAQAPTTERCDNKDNDCDGKIDETLSQSCSNNCGKGTETCSAGKWVSCSAPKAGTETCNGKDDDCDGQTDEGNPGGGKACTISRTFGECAKGIITCTSAKLSCKALYTKKTETCDGKDNDCDGKTDESDPSIGKACTLTANKGECRRGQYACTSGRLYCRQIGFSVTEKCRDNKDNDCDGQIDEICGTAYTYASISSSGTLRYKRNISKVTKTATGTYNIFASSSTYGCDKRPLFVAASSSLMRATSYTCKNTTSYEVKIASHALRGSPITLNDVAHNVVIPAASKGAAYGTYTCKLFSNPFRYVCSVSRSYGSPVVTKYGTGVFDIAFAGCNSATQPVFASIYSSSPSGYATAYYLSSGKCRVRTYDLTGKLSDRWFSFWIPNRTKAAYAIISSSGSIYASNYFGDAKARWTSKVLKNTQGSFSRFETKFPAWDSSTAIFTNPRIGSDYHTPSLSTTGGAWTYSRRITTATVTATYFSILFVQ